MAHNLVASSDGLQPKREAWTRALTTLFAKFGALCELESFQTLIEF